MFLQKKVFSIFFLVLHGTHWAENKIGYARLVYHHDQSIENLFHVSARYDFIKTLKRASNDLLFDVQPEIVADFLLFEFDFIDKSIYDIEKIK